MKNKYLYLLCSLFCVFSLGDVANASETKADADVKTQEVSHTTQHPPHDHHDTDHLKILKDMDKKRRKKLEDENLD